ncbi:MAG: c-type cytochrome [Bacteroidota bacterium]|nr:c-type cytochrome [Bacteroidota bacterium]
MAICCTQQSTHISQVPSSDSLQKVIARGSHLVNDVAACMHCHAERDFTKFAGPAVPGTDGKGGNIFDQTIFYATPGTIYSRNITPDSASGLGTWTDAEILRALTQGIRKNGDTLVPVMPYANYNKMTKNDLLSIIAYLRTLKPIHYQVPPRKLVIPISRIYPAGELQKSVEGNICPPESDSVKYGGYLVTVAGCADCHNPFVKGQPDLSRPFAGGNLFTLPTFKVAASNITPDSATGIGSWDEQTFLKKFTTCRKKSGYDFNPGKYNTLMPIVAYSGMTDGELKAIYLYLRSIKPIHNLVKKYPD